MSFEDLLAAWSGDVGALARADMDDWHAKREAALPQLLDLVRAFLDAELDATAFRSKVDSFSKLNPLWGFQGTALMFFTQLWKAADGDELAAALRWTIRPPDDEESCRRQIEGFRDFVLRTRERAKASGRSQPQVGRINFFLSFFWEAQARDAWPIYYPNSRDVLANHGLLHVQGRPVEDYLAYRTAMFELAARLDVSTWAVEALLWNLGTGATVAPPEPPTGSGDLGGDVYSHYRDQGLIFPDEIVTSLVLSLLTKRFLILSGISGTGKTKLAQGLAVYLERLVAVTETVEIVPEDDESTMHLLVTEPRLERGALYLRSAQEAFLDVPARGAHREDTVALPGGQQGEVRIRNMDFADQSRRLVRLSFRGKAREWFSAQAVGAYVAAGLDEDGAVVSLQPVETKVEEVTEPRRRHEVIPVKSDWTDPRGLLGYHNPLTGSYVGTPLIRLMLAAAADPQNPYLAILDEMNLARVEYYLSDFLSAAESGEPIPLRPADSVGPDEAGDAVPHELAIPPNLTFVGTVNVDETTHAFSPKVLDRANVIEFNAVDVGRALGADAVVEAGSFRLGSDVAPPWFVEEAGRAAAAKQRALGESSFTTWLTEVHELLARYDLHFGYRVIDEVATYVGHAAHLVDGDPQQVVRVAFDLQMVQKVLPKLAGGRELEEPLAHLLRYCVVAEDSGPVTATAALDLATAALAPDADEGAEAMFPRSARKLRRMLSTLRRVGFVAALQ